MTHDRFWRWRTAMTNPEHEVREVAEALHESAEGLHRAADLVEDRAAASALQEMSDMRESAARTVITLAADAGVVIDLDLGEGLEGKLRHGWMKLEAATAGDEAVLDTVVTQEDQLVGRIDSALGADLPPTVKDQLRLADVQVRDGVRLLSNWG